MIGGLERVKLSGTHEIAALTSSWPIRERFCYKNCQEKQFRVKNYDQTFALELQSMLFYT